MAITVVQSTKGHDSGFNGSVTTAAFGSATTTGNAIVAVVSADSGTLNDITSVTDSKSNTYTRLASINNGTGADEIEIWWCQSIVGGATHTVTGNDGSFSVGCVIAYEISGLPATGNIKDFTTAPTGTGTSGSQSTNSLTTTNANDILIAGAVLSSTSANTWTAGTNFTNGVSDVGTSAGLNTFAEVRIVSATGTYSGASTSSIANQSWAMTMVALSDTVLGGAGSSSPVAKRLLVNQTVNRASTF